jgi:hypothetical protein
VGRGHEEDPAVEFDEPQKKFKNGRLGPIRRVEL